jgi:1,4-alpha-glucan branching enzyme
MRPSTSVVPPGGKGAIMRSGFAGQPSWAWAVAGSSATIAAPPAGVQVVRFSLSAPQARQVSLVGDFNGWDPAATALQERDGTWTVVIPVAPGRHQYGFVIDGTEWIADPEAARTADADFGTANSVVYVGS